MIPYTETYSEYTTPASIGGQLPLEGGKESRMICKRLYIPPSKGELEYTTPTPISLHNIRNE